jgi:hypothetical protein
MKVKLLEDTLAGKAGETVDINSARAKAFVEAGQAEWPDEKKKVKEKNDNAGPNGKKK